MTDLNRYLLVPAILLVALMPVATVWAEITWSGNLDPEDPTVGTEFSQVIVGNIADGEMQIAGGSVLQTASGILGNETASSGGVSILGAGSEWDSRNSLYVGWKGEGELQIISGGLATTDRANIGSDVGSIGEVNVSGSDSQFLAGFLFVGNAGSGKLTIQEGAEVVSGPGYVGAGSSSSGEVVISGVGSNWRNFNQLTVGGDGTGRLTVEAGGTVTSGRVSIGNDGGVYGDATVTGSGSRWDSGEMLIGGGGLFVGGAGSGSMTVAEGGRVNSASARINLTPGSTGSATVTGAGSQWNVANSLATGDFGRGSLTVSDGGFVSAGTLLGSLGDLHGDGSMAIGGAVVDDSLSFNSTTGAELEIGFGSGGSLTLTPGAGDMGAGYRGVGALSISEGVKIESENAYLGYGDGAAGTASVLGDGTQWSVRGELRVGHYGSGSLSVAAGSVLRTNRAYMGRYVGANGSVVIDGPESIWMNTTDLYVGYLGGGEVTVTNGAHIETGSLLASLADLHGDGTISAKGVVLDTDLKFDASTGLEAGIRFGSGGLIEVVAEGGYLGAGYSGSGSLEIEDITVSSYLGALGYHTGAWGTATISGPRSRWEITENLWVGLSGRGEVAVQGGATVSSRIAKLGGSEFAEGAVTVDGPGSRWLVSGSMGGGNVTIGAEGSGTLSIGRGGMVSAQIITLGYNPSGAGSVAVTGGSSILSVASLLTVGHRGSGVIDITRDGLVDVGYKLAIDPNNNGDSHINLSTGGMLALFGEADDSLLEFYDLIDGTDALRFWDDSLADWAPLVDATFGEDYTLEYLTEGDLAGYTLLTVGAYAPELAGDFNQDGVVNAADYTVWRDGLGSLYTHDDYAAWRSNYGATSPPPPSEQAAVPEPAAAVLVGLAAAGLLLRRHAEA